MPALATALALALATGCSSRDLSLDEDLVLDGRAYERLAGSVGRVPDPDGGNRTAFDVPPPTLASGEVAKRPVSLDEVLRLALGNAAVIRDDAQFLAASNPVLASPNRVPSAFDLGIQETGGLGGGSGVDAARSQFDPLFVAGASAGQNDVVQNSRVISGGLTPGSVLQDDSGLFTTRVEQRFRSGGLFSLGHDVNYSANNQPTRSFPSAFAGLLRAEVRQPLMAGFGTEFTDVAGPVSRNPAAVQPVDRGIVIARLNERVSVVDFESNVRNLVHSVRSAYWNLVLAEAVHENHVAARDAAEKLWETVRTRFASGLANVSVADEARAREFFYEWRGLAETARADVVEAEARLNRLCGLSPGEATLEPVDSDEVDAELDVEWRIALAEALSRRVELRRQKANIRGIALQLEASRSLSKPRLDLVAGYQLNGFGGAPLGDVSGLGNTYTSLAAADQAGWDVGVEFSMPFGARMAKSYSRNLELRLSKARAVLAAQELEIAHELANAMRELERWAAARETRRLRVEAAEQRASALAAAYDAGRTELDDLLRATTSLMTARNELAQARIAYRKACVDFHYRKGTLLDDSGVRLAEGTWDAKAYAESLQRNWDRADEFPRQPPQDGRPPAIDPDEAALSKERDRVTPDRSDADAEAG